MIIESEILGILVLKCGDVSVGSDGTHIPEKVHCNPKEKKHHQSTFFKSNSQDSKMFIDQGPKRYVFSSDSEI